MAKSHDRRKWPRKPVSRRVTIILDSGHELAVRLRNMSRGGASLELNRGESADWLPADFIVRDTDGVERSARIAWRSRERIGILFIREDGEPAARKPAGFGKRGPM